MSSIYSGFKVSHIHTHQPIHLFIISHIVGMFSKFDKAISLIKPYCLNIVLPNSQPYKRFIHCNRQFSDLLQYPKAYFFTLKFPADIYAFQFQAITPL